MNGPHTGMGAPGPRGAPDLADSPRSEQRCQQFALEAGRWAPSAPGARNLSAAESSRRQGGAHEDREVGENADCDSWVRDKVLFLLHPERWLGTKGDAAPEEVADEEDLFKAQGQDREPNCSSPLFPRKIRISGSRVDAPSRAPKPLLVRVLDYEVTQEVLEVAWAKGSMTTLTEERSMTAVTFRTNTE